MNRYRSLYLKLPNLVKYLLRYCGIVVIVGSGIGLHAILHTPRVSGQGSDGWSPQTQIPSYHSETEPPLLLADQNGTVHAFSSQWLGEESDKPVQAILYNQWTQEQGWSTPIDILLSPHKNQARLTGAFLDHFGTVHLTFFGGIGEDANIYYTRAPLVNAGQAPAWSTPVLVAAQANDPALAVLTGDDHGNLVVIYSGMDEGWGLYGIYSSDGGDTWTEPAPLFLTYAELFPVYLNLVRTPAGLVHMVWDVRTRAGQGRQINFAQLDIATRQWSQPVRLGEADSGYGVLLPTIVEHNGELIAAWSGITMRRSTDGGLTWSNATTPFRLVGVNGSGSFAVDSNNVLHYLWAQRITGSPDIHGVWHSIWQDGRWTEPKAVVSGPQVDDLTGDKAFDPADARVVVSQGNVLLVVWHQDPGLKGNGVWYSQSVLNAPPLPRATLPSPSIQPMTTTIPLRVMPAFTPTPMPKVVLSDQWGEQPDIRNNPSVPLFLGSLFATLLTVGAIGFHQLFRRRR